MIETKKEAQEIADKYNKLKSDKERLLFIIESKKDLKIILDNDESQVCFTKRKFCNIDLNDFDEDFGNRDGVMLLFDTLGIKAEYC